MALSIDIETIEQVQVVHLVGDIDGATAPEAQVKIIAAAEEGCKMILDMIGVSFMSSAGLRMLLVIYRSINRQCGQVVLAGLRSDLKDTMEMTGFLDFFQYRDTLDSALAAVV